ncbi:hypothetical protein D9M68_450340 [compost metagenome]
MAREVEGEHREHQHQQHRRHRAHGPHRQPVARAAHGRTRVLPVRRQRRRDFAARLPDDLQQPLLERLELRATVVDDAKAPLEAHRQAEVDELDEVQVLLRVLHQPRQQLEELLAAPGLVVEHHEQALRRPDAAAPRRERRGLVDRGAQAVARADDHFGRDAGLLRARLETPHLVDQVLAQLRGRRVVAGGADLRDQVEQRVGRRHQRVVARQRRVARMRAPRVVPCGEGIGLRLLLWLRPRAAVRGRAAARIGRHEATRADGHVIGTVHRVPHGRMAQNSMASPGKSPARCMATPPDFSSWRHMSPPLSSSK